jgi:sn-glycerol 3-phosphate transport system permease protein
MRRAYFKNSWIAALVVAPQLLIIFVFFYWPSAQALYWALHAGTALGRRQHLGRPSRISAMSCRMPYYWASVRVSVIFALATTALAMGMALILALFADRQLRGYRGYRVAMIWPYAIAAPAVGLAFRFVFNPNAGHLLLHQQMAPGGGIRR